MPLLPQDNLKKQKILLIILIIVIVAIIITLYFGYFYKNSSITNPFKNNAPESAALQNLLKDLETNLTILDDSNFKNLKIHGKLPIILDATGRTNPFIP